MTKTALIYVRQSKDSETSISPETQESACRALPAVAACDKVIVYRDLGISGGKPPEKRPGFLSMRDRIEASDATHEPLVVAAYDQSRISRSNVDSLQFYAFVEPRLWVDLVMVDGRFDRSAAGELTWGVMALTATHLRKITATKIKAAYRDLNAKGIATGMATYGYRYVNNTRTSGAMQPDPEQAPVVRRIFEMYADGSNTRIIAQTLADERIVANSKRGWLPDTVGGMLSNITYTGRTYSGSRRDKTGDIIQASWPALVDNGLFQRVQDRMKHLAPAPSRFKRATKAAGSPTRKQNPKSANPFVFRGLLWCSECNRKFVAQRQHGQTRYFCGSRETTQPCEHAKHSILEAQFLPWVDDLMHGLELGQLEALLERQQGLRLRKPLIAKETAAGAVENLDARIKRLDTRFALGTIGEPEFKAELETLRRQRAIYVAQLGEQPKPEELEGLAARWKSGDTLDRHELLSALFEKLHVKDGQIIGFTPRGDRVNRVRLLLGTALDYVGGPGASIRDVWRRGRDLNSRWASDP